MVPAKAVRNSKKMYGQNKPPCKAHVKRFPANCEAYLAGRIFQTGFRVLKIKIRIYKGRKKSHGRTTPPTIW